MRLEVGAFMRCWASFIPVNLGSRVVRSVVAFAAAPVLALSPLCAETILIHDHHGHDVHSHKLVLSELDDWLNNPEHRHEEHEHDDQSPDPPADDGGMIVIVLDLPEALPGVRGMSTSTVVVTGFGPSPSPFAVIPTYVGTANGPPRYTRASSFAPRLRADSTVVGILLSNHALLL